MQRVPAGDSASPPPLVHRPVAAGQPATSEHANQPVTGPSAANQSVTGPSADAGQPDGNDPGATESTASTGDQAGLIGETVVSRLATDTDADTDTDTDADADDGSPTAVNDLPLVGPPASGSTPDGGPPSGEGGASTTVQTFVSPDDERPAEAQVAPLLGQPSVATPSSDEEPAPPRVSTPGPAGRSDRATEPGVGRTIGDLPMVSRLASPVSAADSPVRPTGGGANAAPTGSTTQEAPAAFDGGAATPGTDAPTGGIEHSDRDGTGTRRTLPAWLVATVNRRISQPVRVGSPTPHRHHCPSWWPGWSATARSGR